METPIVYNKKAPEHDKHRFNNYFVTLSWRILENTAIHYLLQDVYLSGYGYQHRVIFLASTTKQLVNNYKFYTFHNGFETTTIFLLSFFLTFTEIESITSYIYITRVISLANQGLR